MSSCSLGGPKKCKQEDTSLLKKIFFGDKNKNSMISEIIFILLFNPNAYTSVRKNGKLVFDPHVFYSNLSEENRFPIDNLEGENFYKQIILTLGYSKYLTFLRKVLENYSLEEVCEMRDIISGKFAFKHLDKLQVLNRYILLVDSKELEVKRLVSKSDYERVINRNLNSEIVYNRELEGKILKFIIRDPSLPSFRISQIDKPVTEFSEKNVWQPARNVEIQRYDCPVCLENKIIDDLVFLPCSHKVCEECYKGINKKCPVCRNSFRFGKI